MTTEGLPKWFTKISNLIPNRRTVAQAATASIHTASSNALEGVSGKYFTDTQETKTAKMTKSTENQDYLWEFSEKLVEKAFQPES